MSAFFNVLEGLLRDGDQIPVFEWFQQQQMIRLALGNLPRTTGHEDNRDSRATAYLVHCFDPASRVQLYVGGDEVRAPSLREADRVFLGDREVEGSKAALAEALLDQQGNQDFVFNDQGVDRASPGAEHDGRLRAEATRRDLEHTLTDERVFRCAVTNL